MFRVHLLIKQQVTYETEHAFAYTNCRLGRPNARTLHPTANEPITEAAHADYNFSLDLTGGIRTSNGEISSVAVPIFRLLLKIAERLISTSRLTQFFWRICASTSKPTTTPQTPIPPLIHPPVCLQIKLHPCDIVPVHVLMSGVKAWQLCKIAVNVRTHN